MGEDVAWIHLAQDKKKWRAFMNTIMNLTSPLNGENFLTS
jgi:hypothetical protein